MTLRKWPYVWVAAGLATLGSAVPAAAQPAGTPVSIDARARLSVGVVDGDPMQEFDGVATPFLLPDGRLVVALQGANSIRIFGPDGRFQTSLGRAGRGPGEFTSLLSAWPRGDTIEALDWRVHRIVRFLPDGSSEEIPIRTPLTDLSAVAGVMGDGWVVGGVALGGFGRRDSVVVRQIGRDGGDLGQIAHAFGFERYRVSGLGGGPAPLSPRAALAVHGDHVYVAETLTPSIRIFAAAGTTAREVHWPVQQHPDARAVQRRVIEAAVDQAEPDQAVNLRRLLEGAPEPRQVPVFWTFLVDSDGFIWIRPYDPMRHAFTRSPSGWEGGRWTILSPAGAVVGTVNVPADLELHQITRDAVVGIARDELGVESVRVHTLRRR